MHTINNEYFEAENMVIHEFHQICFHFQQQKISESSLSISTISNFSNTKKIIQILDKLQFICVFQLRVLDDNTWRVLSIKNSETKNCKPIMEMKSKKFVGSPF